MSFFGPDATLWLALCAVILNGLLWFALYQRERKLRRSERNLSHHLQKVTEQANTRSLGIVERASEKASQILAETDFISNSLHSELEKSFSHLLKTNETKINRFLEKVDDHNRELLGHMEERVNAKMDTELMRIIAENEDLTRTFVKRLEGTVAYANEDFQKRLQVAYSQSLKDIESYKKERLERLDQSMDTLVADLSKEFFTKLPEVSHEELVFESLERAKKSGLL